MRMQWSHRPTGCFPGPRPSSTQAQAFSAGHSATGARPGEAGQLRMPACSHRSRHSTLSLHRTVPGLLLGPPASPLYELLRSTKGEPPPAAPPPLSKVLTHPHPPCPSSTDPPSRPPLPPGPPGTSVLWEGGNLSFGTAQLGGGMAGELF